MAAGQVVADTAARDAHEHVIHVPGDKSITHRAILFASLAHGSSRIRGALDAADTRSTAAVLHALHAIGDSFHGVLTDPLVIDGQGAHTWRAGADVLDCGNSGTTARLMMGAVAGTRLTVVLDGDDSLRQRPMRRVTTPLSAMGARFEDLGTPDRLPVRVHGARLTPLDHFSPQSSAQVKSALLLAGLIGDVRVSVTEPRLSRDHTERMLRAMGADVRHALTSDGAHCITIDGASALSPIDIQVPGDFSSAAFFIACAVLGASASIRMPAVGLNPGRTGMLDVLNRMGATVDVTNRGEEANEPVGDLVARHAELVATTVQPDEIPAMIDEIPIIAALAAMAAGSTTITGASELRVKETDRIRAMVENLRAVGVEAEELPDGLVVTGTDRPLAGHVHAHGDHRIAMAFGVLGAVQGNDITVDDPDVVAVSYPRFWDVLHSITRHVKP